MKFNGELLLAIIFAAAWGGIKLLLTWLLSTIGWGVVYVFMVLFAIIPMYNLIQFWFKNNCDDLEDLIDAIDELSNEHDDNDHNSRIM